MSPWSARVGGKIQSDKNYIHPGDKSEYNDLAPMELTYQHSTEYLIFTQCGF